MNKKKQAIIVYENIVREYDNTLLLQAELEKRGYKVKIVYKTDLLFVPRHNAVIIAPNCYSTENYEYYMYYLNAQSNKFISLQYEQVFSARLEKTGVHLPEGKAKEIYLFCWGENCYRRLLKNGLEASRLRICGAMQLDFLRPEFKDFYLDKKKLAERFHLDMDKKWLLYISSFTYVENPMIDKYAVDQLKDNEFIREFSAVSVASQKTTLEWFEQLIKENKDIIIIYRKHPVEANSTGLKEMVAKYPEHFREISELSVKQWIYVSDICATWISTSSVEAYMSNTPSMVIRPHVIKKENDIPFYYGGQFTDTFEKLKNTVADPTALTQLPFEEELIKDCYLIDEVPAYKKIADEIEAIDATEACIKIKKTFAWDRLVFLMKKGILPKYFIKKIYEFLFIYAKYRIKNEKFRKSYAVDEWEKIAKHRKDSYNVGKYETLTRIVNK